MSDMMNRLSGARSNLAFKTPCRVATTANITLSGYQTIDAVAMNAAAEDADKNMRILVKDQTDQTTNGIYTVSSGVWERAKDFDGNTDVLQGTLVYVADGTTHGGTFYTVTTVDPIELGEDNLTFTAETFNTGDVVGPASAVSGALVGFSGTSGKLIQDLGTFDFRLAYQHWGGFSNTVASAATTSLAGIGHVTQIVSGTTTITSFGTGPSLLRILYFSGALILTHGASLVLPGAANITTVAGDIFFFASNSSSVWYCLGYQRVSGRNLNTGITDTLAKGYTATSYSNGTVTSGTLTPDPANSNFQHYTNGGAHTLAPPTSTCSIVLEMTNNASAGALTTSGFTFASGDSLTTTNGEKFLLYITKSQSYSLLQRKALQ